MGTILRKEDVRRVAIAVATALVATLTLTLALDACGASGTTGSTRPTAVAAFFPIAATMRALVGSRVAVRDLTPPGVEPHDLELTTRDLDAILDAKLVVVMGRGFQPAIERAARNRDGGAVFVLDRLHSGSDPHVWLDPVTMRRVVQVLAASSTRALPTAGATIRANRARLEGELDLLDREYRAGLARCDRRVIVTAHAAFGRLSEQYGLRQEAIAGISPEQEPDPRRLAELADLVRREHVTTVFTERLVSARVARTLAREAGVKTAVLDPIESPRGVTTFAGYLSSMRANLTALRHALGCR